MDPEIEKLAKALRRGERREGDRLFSSFERKYERLVKAVLARYLVSPHDIDELSQETFLDFYRNIDGIESSAKGYLARSAANKALNLLRKRGREEELIDDSSVVSNALSPAAFAFEGEIEAIVGRPDKDLIVLHLLGGYSFEELGAKSGESASRLKTRYYRALRKLRKEYAK